MDASRARSFCPRAILCRRRCARLCLSLFFFFLFFFYLALIFLFFFVFLFPILYECSASSHGPRAELLLSLEPQKVLSWLSCPARLSSPCPRSALRRPSAGPLTASTPRSCASSRPDTGGSGLMIFFLECGRDASLKGRAGDGGRRRRPTSVCPPFRWRPFDVDLAAGAEKLYS